MRQAKGFTLIELMIAVAVIAILSAIGYPSYRDHVRRTQIQEALANLSDYRLRMEQYYQDNRTYANATPACGVAVPAPQDPRFDYAAPGCVLDTTLGAAAGQSYTMTATGNAGYVAGFVFTINERNVRATTGMHTDWGTLPIDAGTRWIARKP
jgi:type IV pilus assembly protein PilE